MYVLIEVYISGRPWPTATSKPGYTGTLSDPALTPHCKGTQEVIVLLIIPAIFRPPKVADAEGVHFTFFFSIFLRHYATYVPAGFGKILGCFRRIQRGAGGPDHTPPLKITKIGFLSNTCPDLLKNHKLPSQHSMLGHYRPASETRFAGGPMMARL